MHQNMEPSGFDLSDPIVSYLPQELIQRWLESDRSDQSHERLLRPYVRYGTVVCSDSSGLSKLTQNRSLIEVLKLISEPKEIIHSHGKSIGGEAIGIWMADNSLMFYPTDIAVQDIVRQMVLAQQQIKTVAVSVGIGLHYGKVYHIGGGLYGDDAVLIEEFTENESRGEDIIVSAVIKQKLAAPFDQFESYQDMFCLQYKDLKCQGDEGRDICYPAPFDQDFQERLRAWDHLNTNITLEEKHQPIESTVALVFFYPENNLRLLDRFVQQLDVSHQTKKITSKHGVELLKTNGLLAVFHSADSSKVVACTKELHQVFQSQNFMVNIGVSRGDIMLFDLENERDLAGDAVNLASKMAEDSEYRGVAIFDKTVREEAIRQGITEAFSFSVSRLRLEGVLLR